MWWAYTDNMKNNMNKSIKKEVIGNFKKLRLLQTNICYFSKIIE